MSQKLIYKNHRPKLTIEVISTSMMGNCYTSTVYRITSARFPVSRTAIDALRKAGFLGFGQEFYVRSRCDGKETPTGYDSVPCIDEDDPHTVPVNRYTQQPYDPINDPYFVYEVEDRVDSSD